MNVKVAFKGQTNLMIWNVFKHFIRNKMSFEIFVSGLADGIDRRKFLFSVGQRLLCEPVSKERQLLRRTQEDRARLFGQKVEEVDVEDRRDGVQQVAKAAQRDVALQLFEEMKPLERVYHYNKKY